MATMNERLGWRPNEIPPEQWERLSHADQLKWWKDRVKTATPKPHMKKGIALYNEGQFTIGSFLCFTVQHATLEEVNEFERECPPVLLR
jgi:hypothetical protein